MPAPAPVGSEVGRPLGTGWGSGMLRSTPSDPRPKTPPARGWYGVGEEEEMDCLSSGVTTASLLALGCPMP